MYPDMDVAMPSISTFGPDPGDSFLKQRHRQGPDRVRRSITEARSAREPRNALYERPQQKILNDTLRPTPNEPEWPGSISTTFRLLTYTNRYVRMRHARPALFESGVSVVITSSLALRLTFRLSQMKHLRLRCACGYPASLAATSSATARSRTALKKPVGRSVWRWLVP